MKLLRKLGMLAAMAALLTMTGAVSAQEAVVPVAQPTVELAGRGQQVTRKFTLQEGLVQYRVTHNGSSNIVIEIKDGATGANVETILNEIGPVDATKATRLRKSGTYVLQVQADGDWTISLDEPRPEDAPEAPQLYSGSGTSVSPFFETDGGLLVIGGTYQGDGRVAIRLRDANGAVVEQIANQVGSYNGSMGVSVTPGIYFLELSGKGDWTVSVE